MSITCVFCLTARCQLTISGTVYDSTKQIPVKDVVIKSSNGTSTITDSLGHYAIVTTDKDSLTFIYQNKPTAKFAVKQIPNIGNFEISLHVRVPEKFRTLKEVRVYSKNFKQDSIENREQYAKIFNYQRPGVRTSTDTYTGAAGMDLEAPCTINDSSGDKNFIVYRRKAGDVSAGGGGQGTIQILGGTGKFAGVTGACTYTVAFFPGNRGVTTQKCRWQKP